MTIDDFEHALAEGFGLSEQAVRSAFETALRAKVTAEPASAESAENEISPQRIAAYLAGQLNEAERAKIHASMLASPTFFDEVMALADYLDETEAASSASPEEVAGFVKGLRDFIRGKGSEGISIPSPDLRAALQRLPELQAKFEELLHEGAVLFKGKPMEARAVSAAADKGEVNHRKFRGGQLSIAPTPTGDSVMIVFALESTAPGFVIVRGADGIPVRQDLPPPLGSGNRLIVKKLKTEQDKLLLQLLRDPQSTISFLEKKSDD
jgi:hypothetical protein